jgi:hypothetical protein
MAFSQAGFSDTERIRLFNFYNKGDATILKPDLQSHDPENILQHQVQ